jgi:hypothetical protein
VREVFLVRMPAGDEGKVTEDLQNGQGIVLPPSSGE